MFGDPLLGVQRAVRHKAKRAQGPRGPLWVQRRHGPKRPNPSGIPTSSAPPGILHTPRRDPMESPLGSIGTPTYMDPLGLAPPRVLGPGEGVGGGVNPSSREEGKGMRPVQRAKPPQPRGLVGFKKKTSRITTPDFLTPDYRASFFSLWGGRG